MPQRCSKQRKGKGKAGAKAPAITEYRYWPKDKKIPGGWKLANKLDTCHHGHHAVLIRKKVATGKKA